MIAGTTSASRGSTARATTGDLRLRTGNARGAFWVVYAALAGGYDGVVHVDVRPPRTEHDEGVRASAAGWHSGLGTDSEHYLP